MLVTHHLAHPNSAKPKAAGGISGSLEHSTTCSHITQLQTEIGYSTAQHNQFQIRLHERDADLF